MYVLSWDDNSSLGLSSAVVFVRPGFSLQASELFSTLSTHKDHLAMKFSQRVDSRFCRGWGVGLIGLGWDWVTVLFRKFPRWFSLAAEVEKLYDNEIQGEAGSRRRRYASSDGFMGTHFPRMITTQEKRPDVCSNWKIN